MDVDLLTQPEMEWDVSVWSVFVVGVANTVIVYSELYSFLQVNLRIYSSMWKYANVVTINVFFLISQQKLQCCWAVI